MPSESTRVRSIRRSNNSRCARRRGLGVARHLSRDQRFGPEQRRRRAREPGERHVALLLHLREHPELARRELQAERRDRIEHQHFAEALGLGGQHVRADDAAGRMPVQMAVADAERVEQREHVARRACASSSSSNRTAGSGLSESPQPRHSAAITRSDCGSSGSTRPSQSAQPRLPCTASTTLSPAPCST